MVDTFDLIFISTQAILLILFLIQIRINGRAASYLVIAMIFGIIATGLSILRGFVSGPLVDRSLLALQLVVYGIEYILIYLHFRGTISDKLNFIQTFIISFIFGIHTAYGIYFAIFGVDDIPEFIWDVSYNLLGISVFAFVTYSLFLAYIHTREISALIQVIAGSLIGIGFFASIFQTPMIDQSIPFTVSGLITGLLKSAGILLILIVYIINPDFIERLPVQTYGIMAFDKGGNTISYHQIKSRGIFEDVSMNAEASLITALTRAVLSFIKETLGTKTDLDRIEAEDKLIMFNIGTDIGVAVIAEKGTQILIESIKRCQRRLDQELSSEIKKGEINKAKVRSIMSTSFPYIMFTG